jgi:hypothetical protein
MVAGAAMFHTISGPLLLFELLLDRRIEYTSALSVDGTLSAQLACGWRGRKSFRGALTV